MSKKTRPVPAVKTVAKGRNIILQHFFPIDQEGMKQPDTSKMAEREAHADWQRLFVNNTGNEKHAGYKHGSGIKL